MPTLTFLGPDDVATIGGLVCPVGVPVDATTDEVALALSLRYATFDVDGVVHDGGVEVAPPPIPDNYTAPGSIYADGAAFTIEASNDGSNWYAPPDQPEQAFVADQPVEDATQAAATADEEV